MQLDDVARIALDMRSSSTLDWKLQRRQAVAAVGAGKKILWEWDLGLFRHLLKPLENQEQFLNLTLGIDHFLKTLWVEFENYTAGALLYKGPQEFSLSADPLDGRAIAADYINQLTVKVPDALSIFLEFTDPHADPLYAILLSDPSAYGRVMLIRKDALDWHVEEQASCAILMPHIEERRAEVLDLFRSKLLEIKTLYKKIPELHLIGCWEGLDLLVFSEKALSPQGLRQLKGFIAAGGEVIELSDFKGQPYGTKLS